WVGRLLKDFGPMTANRCDTNVSGGTLLDERTAASHGYPHLARRHPQTWVDRPQVGAEGSVLTAQQHMKDMRTAVIHPNKPVDQICGVRGREDSHLGFPSESSAWPSGGTDDRKRD